MKIAVVGAGAVGGYFGARLAAAGEDVTFLARGRQLAALASDGISIASPRGDLRLQHVATADRTAAIGPVDLALFAVKLYDAEQAAATLGPLVGPTTVVVTLQNGVEVVDWVARHVGPERVAGGAAYIVCALEAPGRIRHLVADTLVFGLGGGTRSPALAALEAAGRRAGFQARQSATIEVDLWTKFVRLATWSGMTAVTRSSLGVIRDDPTLTTMMRAALDEAIAVGRARGVELGPDIPAETDALVRGFPAHAKSSMLDDLEHGRRLELPWLSGAVVRMGREAGVPTPTHAFIAAVLAPFVGGAER